MPVGRCGPALAPLAEASFGDVLGAGWQRALEPEGAALPRPRDGTVLGAGRADASAWTLDTPKVQLLLSALCGAVARGASRRRAEQASRAVAAPPKPFPVGISSVRAQAELAKAALRAPPPAPPPGLNPAPRRRGRRR